MRHHVILSTLLLALLAGPAPVNAQADPAQDPLAAAERGLLEQLCSVDISDEMGIATCLLTVGAILGGDAIVAPDAEPSAGTGGLLDRARQAVDEALGSVQSKAQQIDLRGAVDEAIAAAQATAREIDLQAALDEAVSSVQDVDLQAALDEAVGAAEDVDVEAALAAALAAAQSVDLQAALDEALATADEAIASAGAVAVEALLADSVETTREVVGQAQAWVAENSDTVCKGSSLSVGTSAAAVVAYLTGSPGLAIRAFEETERLSNDICGDVAQGAASPEPSPDQG